MLATGQSTFDASARGPDTGERSPRRGRGVRAGLTVILALTLMAVAAPAATAAPWVCDGTGYITRWDADPPPTGTGGNTQFLRAVRQPNGNYTFALLGSFAATHVNALAFRPQDGFMYAFNNNTERVVRIERAANGNMDPTTLPPTAGLPPNFATVIGTVLVDGRYFMYGTAGPGNDPIGVLVDVEANTATTLTPGPGFTMGSDVAVSPVDGRIYSSNPNGVFEIVITGSTLSVGPRVADGNTSGAQWFLPDGRLVQYNNASGEVFVSNFDTGQSTRLGGAPVLSNVDGASCANSIAVTKDASPRTVTAGTELTYTYALEANGLVDNAVDFLDTLPTGMTYVPGGVTINGTFGSPNDYGGTNTLEISGTIPRNTTVTITARVLVSADHACGADVDNQAQATMHAAGLPDVTILSDDPTTPTELDDPTTIRVVCAADVVIVKSASTSPIVPGEEATFQFVATNNGPSTAANVRVSDQLPAEFAFSSASPGCAEAGGTLTCTVGSLAVGASQTFTVTGQVASSLDECLENTATVASDTPDPNAANNTSTICTPINIRSNLSITKAASTATVPPGGGQVMYTLVVRNAGPSDDPGAEVVDPLPAGLTLISAEPSQGSCSTAGNTVSCELGRLRDGGTAQVLVTANTTGSAGCITNTARVQGAGDDPSPEDNQASAEVCVQPPPEPPTMFDLEVDKRVNVSRPRIGQRVTYTIVVRNNGPDAAPAARLTDTYNARATLVSVRTSQGSCTRPIPITCDLGRIEAGASATVTVVIKPRELGPARNAASATSCCGTDGDPGNNMDTADIRVRKVTLRISKVASRASVLAGQTLSYRIRVRNPTRGEARRVRVCDRLPSGLSFRSSRPRAQRAGRQRCWTINRLGARQSRTFRVTVRAADGAIGRKVNRASASSPDAVRRVSDRDPVRVLGQPTPVTG